MFESFYSSYPLNNPVPLNPVSWTWPTYSSLGLGAELAGSSAFRKKKH